MTINQKMIWFIDELIILKLNSDSIYFIHTATYNTAMIKNKVLQRQLLKLYKK